MIFHPRAFITLFSDPHTSVTALPCAGQPCCARPTSLWPSGSTARSPFSNWPRTLPSCPEHAASGWGFAGAGKEPRTPSRPTGKEMKTGSRSASSPDWKNSSPHLFCSLWSHFTTSFVRPSVPPLNLGTVPPPRIPAVRRSAGRAAAESWRSSPHRGSSSQRRTAWRRTRWSQCAQGQTLASTPENHIETSQLISPTFQQTRVFIGVDFKGC